MPDLRQLRTLVVVAEEFSFSRAAERLCSSICRWYRGGCRPAVMVPTGGRPAQQGRSVRSLEEELTLLVCRAQRVHLHDEGGDLRLLERSAYSVLGGVHDEGVVRLSELAAAFMLDVSTVSRQVAALQAAGLIRRDPDPSDGRAAC